MKRKTIHFLTASTDNNSDPKQTQRIEIPRTITLGGQEFSIADTPELANLLNLVRKDTSIVEKAKIYPYMEKLKQQVETLANTQVIDPSTGNAIDEGKINNMIESKMDAMMNQFKTIVQPLVNANQRTEEQQLEAYREKLIRENVGKVIPELVVGSSYEELDKAVEQSKLAFESARHLFGVKTQEEILAEQRQQQAPAQQQAPQFVAPTVAPQTQVAPGSASQTAPSTPEVVQAPTVQATPANLTPNFPTSPTSTEVTDLQTPTAGSMSMEEFASKREQLKQDLAKFSAL